MRVIQNKTAAAVAAYLRGSITKDTSLGGNTYLEIHGEGQQEFATVRLYGTDVVKVTKAGAIFAKTGGYNTPTTKSRISAALAGAGLHTSVGNKAGTCYAGGIDISSREWVQVRAS